MQGPLYRHMRVVQNQALHNHHHHDDNDLQLLGSPRKCKAGLDKTFIGGYRHCQAQGYGWIGLYSFHLLTSNFYTSNFVLKVPSGPFQSL